MGQFVLAVVLSEILSLMLFQCKDIELSVKDVIIWMVCIMHVCSLYFFPFFRMDMSSD